MGCGFGPAARVDPKWANTCLHMSINPWTSGVLPRKTVELIIVALNVACTNLNAPPHSRRARCGCDPRRDFDSVQNGVRHVYPFMQPGRFHSSRGGHHGALGVGE